MNKEQKVKPNIKAMVFDMDGTVIDSNKLDYKAWQEVFKKHDVDLGYKEYTTLLGATSEEIIKKYIDLNDDEIDNFIEKRESLFKKFVKEEGLYAMEQIEDLLKQIKNSGIKMALATGAQREKLNYMMEIVDLRNYFDEIVTADDVEKGKPHPETFLKAAEKFNVSPDEVIVWEDAQKGVEAAKNGNFRCVAITTTNGSKEGLEKADVTIDTYKNIKLEDILNKFKE